MMTTHHFNFRKYALTISFLGATLPLAPSAHAQEAVIDSYNLAQNIQTAAQSIAAVEQLKEQLTQLEQTYQMFTNPTNILNMATGMENQAIENPMPDVNALEGIVGGESAPSGAASTYFNQNHVYTPTDGSIASTALNTNANAIANIEGVASTNLNAIEQRLNQLPDLESDLNSATSITQVNAINGRIAAESQFVQAQQAQATNLQTLAMEQGQAHEQAVEEEHAQEAASLSAQYGQAAGQ